MREMKNIFGYKTTTHLGTKRPGYTHTHLFYCLTLSNIETKVEYLLEERYSNPISLGLPEDFGSVANKMVGVDI